MSADRRDKMLGSCIADINIWGSKALVSSLFPRLSSDVAITLYQYQLIRLREWGCGLSLTVQWDIGDD